MTTRKSGDNSFKVTADILAVLRPIIEKYESVFFGGRLRKFKPSQIEAMNKFMMRNLNLGVGTFSNIYH